MALPYPVLLPMAFGSGTGGNVGTMNTLGTVASGVLTSPSNSPFASLNDGFPAIDMANPSSGGIAPAGGDFNAILNYITSFQAWVNAGGTFKFNAALATAIGGYQPGNTIMLNNNLTEVTCTASNNFNDPNSNMTGWVISGPYAPSGQVLYGNAGGNGYTSGSLLTASSTAVTVTNTALVAAPFIVTSTNTPVATASSPYSAAQISTVYTGAFGNSYNSFGLISGVNGATISCVNQATAGTVATQCGLYVFCDTPSSGTTTSLTGANILVTASGTGVGTVAVTTGLVVAVIATATQKMAVATGVQVVMSGAASVSGTVIGISIPAFSFGATNYGIVSGTAVKITDPTQSTSPLTGALIVSGGVAVGKNLTVQGVVGSCMCITNNTANGSVACVFTASVGPTGASTAIQGWETIQVNGVTHYRPYW